MTITDRLRRWSRALTLDLRPLRVYRDFRLSTLATACSGFGAFFTMVAVPIQLTQLTDSTIAVGLVGAAEFVPIVVLGLLGGAIADRYDRRRVVLVTEVASLLCTAALLANALAPRPQLWVIYLIAAGAVSATSLQRPSLDAMLPRFVPHQDLTAASAVDHALFGVANLLGTVTAGVVASTSVASAYAVDCATFAASLAFFLRVTPVPPLAMTATTGIRAALGDVGAGLRYAAGRRDLLGTYVVDTVAMTMAMPLALFPFFASVLHADHAVGLLYAAEAFGGLIAGALSGWVRRVHRHGRAIMLAAGCWGAAVGLAGIMPNLGWALVLLAVAGAADMVSGTFRGALWNQTIPDELRGRLAGIELLSYSIGPTLGNARAGLMAVRGVRFSIAAGGLLCVGGVALTGVLLPGFRRYDDRTDAHALAQRARSAAPADIAAPADTAGTP